MSSTPNLQAQSKANTSKNMLGAAELMNFMVKHEYAKVNLKILLPWDTGGILMLSQWLLKESFDSGPTFGELPSPGNEALAS